MSEYPPLTALAPPHDNHPERGDAPALSACGLTKRFTPRRAMRDILRFAARPPAIAVADAVTLEVHPGEVFGLLGPNGAGKTTIFKMLSTMIAADAGFATVQGFDIVRQAAEVRRVLASVPADERSLNWRLSARQNLELFAALQRVPRAESSSRIEWVLRTVDLGDTGSKRVAEFSSGMRQRLLIARALLTKPRILLLDEPTRTLDPISARELRSFLREELVLRHGCTIMIATHNTDEAFTFCDRVAVLHQGRVLATGATRTLSARFGDARYRMLTDDAAHPGFAALTQRGFLQRVIATGPETEGWTTLECSIPGGPARSAEVLRMLVERGVPVARLERVEPSLADLISRIIGADRTGARNA